MEPPWQTQQKKAFSGFCNLYLAQRNITIKDIDQELRSGVILWHLLEVISGKKLPSIEQNPKSKFQKIANLDTCIQFLKSQKLPLVNISGEDIEAGKTQMTLGLIWTVILKYHIQNPGMLSAQKQALLEWVNSAIKPHSVTNFTKSFCDGIAFCALVNYVQPSTILDLEKMNPKQRLEKAFNEAFVLGIPMLLDVEFTLTNPDEHSIMTYVEFFRKKDNLPTSTPPAKNASGLVAEDFEIIGLEEPLVQYKLVQFVIAKRNPNKQGIPQSIEAIIEGPNGKVSSNITTTDEGDFEVDFLPSLVGAYKVTVLVNNTPIPGTPFCIAQLQPPHVFSGVVNFHEKAAIRASVEPLLIAEPSKCTAHPPETCLQHEPLLFEIIVRDSRGDDMTEPVDIGVLLKPHNRRRSVAAAQFTNYDGHYDENLPNPDFVETEATLFNNYDGSYTVQITPTLQGLQLLTITVNGMEIQGSPYIIMVQSGNPAEKAYPAKCMAMGPGLVSATEGMVCSFVIQARNKDGENIIVGGDTFKVTMQGPKGTVEHWMKDNSDGTYTVEYLPTEAGIYKISITLHGESIEGSKFIVMAKPVVSAFNCIAFGPGLKQPAAYEETFFRIEAKDKRNKMMIDGNADFDVIVTSPTGKKEQVYIDFNRVGDGTYYCGYTPQEQGNYTLEVKINGEHIQGSPFHPFVEEAKNGKEKKSRVELAKLEDNVPRKHRASLFMTKLYTASYNGNSGLAQTELTRGAEVNAQDQEGWTPLHAACDQGHLDVVKILIQHHAKINVLNSSGTSPLYLAVAKGRKRIAKYLVENGADVNLSKKGGWTPLHIACFHEFSNLTTYLIQRGANLDVTCDEMQGYTPLHILLASERPPMELVKLIVKKGCRLDLQSKSGNTPLHIACFFGSMEAVEFLISRAPLEIKNNKGRTPFAEASFYGHQKLVTFMSQFTRERIPMYTRSHNPKSKGMEVGTEQPPLPEVWRKALPKYASPQASPLKPY